MLRDFLRLLQGQFICLSRAWGPLETQPGDDYQEEPSVRRYRPLLASGRSICPFLMIYVSSIEKRISYFGNAYFTLKVSFPYSENAIRLRISKYFQLFHSCWLFTLFPNILAVNFYHSGKCFQILSFLFLQCVIPSWPCQLCNCFLFFPFRPQMELILWQMRGIQDAWNNITVNNSKFLTTDYLMNLLDNVFDI